VKVETSGMKIRTLGRHNNETKDIGEIWQCNSGIDEIVRVKTSTSGNLAKSLPMQPGYVS